jgi:hypothetical protein
LIAAQRPSGQTIAAFCVEHRIPRSSFYKWQQKFGASLTKDRARAAAKQFLPVPIRAATTPASASGAVELQLGAVQVQLAGAAASRVVEAILAHLAGPM